MQERWQNGLSYGVYPVNVRADLGEDSGLLGVVAAQARAKADNAMDLPAPVTILAGQGATRVPLIQCDRQKCFFFCNYQLCTCSFSTCFYFYRWQEMAILPILSWACDLMISQLQTHVATSHHPISACTDHFGGHLWTPPVILGAGGMVHHGQESLLQNISNGTSSCGQERCI